MTRRPVARGALVARRPKETGRQARRALVLLALAQSVQRQVVRYQFLQREPQLRRVLAVSQQGQ